MTASDEKPGWCPICRGEIKLMDDTVFYQDGWGIVTEVHAACWDRLHPERREEVKHGNAE